MTFIAICTTVLLAAVNGFDNCQPSIEDMTLYVTWYSDENGSGDGLFASLAEVSPEWHMNMIACDPSMFGEILEINLGDGWDTMYCGDQFGYHPNGDKVLTIFYDLETDTWFTRIDIYWSLWLIGEPPSWGILYTNDWKRVGTSRYTAQQMAELGKIP